jgi:hypothetical protein
MRTSICRFALLGLMACRPACAGDVSTPEWGPVTKNAQLSVNLRADGKSIEASQPVKLIIRFRNVSTNETLIVLLSNAEEHNAEFSFVVRLPSGKDVTLTPGAHHGSGAILHLAPSGTHAIDFNLSRLWRFDQPGAYQITAKCRVDIGASKSFQIVSNPLSVLVVPDR